MAVVADDGVLERCERSAWAAAAAETAFASMTVSGMEDRRLTMVDGMEERFEKVGDMGGEYGAAGMVP